MPCHCCGKFRRVRRFFARNNAIGLCIECRESPDVQMILGDFTIPDFSKKKVIEGLREWNTDTSSVCSTGKNF